MKESPPRNPLLIHIEVFSRGWADPGLLYRPIEKYRGIGIEKE